MQKESLLDSVVRGKCQITLQCLCSLELVQRQKWIRLHINKGIGNNDRFFACVSEN